MIAGNLNGLFAPAGVPKPIVDQIADATRKIMADADFQRILVDVGLRADHSTPAPRRRGSSSAEELARWTPIMKATGFKME